MGSAAKEGSKKKAPAKKKAATKKPAAKRKPRGSATLGLNNGQKATKRKTGGKNAS